MKIEPTVPRLSVIIPTRRFDGRLRRRIEESLIRLPRTEVLVVEPEGLAPARSSSRGEGDLDANESARPASQGGVRVLEAPPGRGPQCNLGARAALGDLLLFLHDDTELPAAAPRLIEQAFGDPAIGAACFRLRFDRRHWLLAAYAFFTRFDSMLTTFGDQGIVIRRSLFNELGGFPNWPLFEDVELVRRVRRRARILKLPEAVTTSAERFDRNGILRQQIANAWLLLRFRFGATPESLAVSYERRRMRL